MLVGSGCSSPQSSKKMCRLPTPARVLPLQIFTWSQMRTPTAEAASRSKSLPVSGTLHTSGWSPAGRTRILLAIFCPAVAWRPPGTCVCMQR